MSNPCSSRRCVQASTSQAGSTTKVVSPKASASETSPGTSLKVMWALPSAAMGQSSPAENVQHFSRKRPLLCHSADLVGRRHAGLNPLMQPDDPLHQALGPRGAARDVDVDRQDLVDALEDRVVVEHAARARAGAHGDYPLRLQHLVVDLL